MREAHVLGSYVRAAAAQEVRQLLAAAVTVRGDPNRAARSVGCDVYYQDKPLSCTWI
jgi:hypothetical protein